MICSKCKKDFETLENGLCEKCLRESYDILKREITRETDKTVVNNEFEELIIAGVMNDPFIMNKAFQYGLDTDLFTNPDMIDIIGVIKQAFSERPDFLDPAVIKEKLRGTGRTSAADCIEHLRNIKNIKFSQVKIYIDLLKESQAINVLREAGLQMIEYAEGSEEKDKKYVIDFIGETIQRLSRIQKQQMQKTVTTVKKELLDIAQDISKRNQEGELLTIGYDIRPFNDLNQSLSGLRKGFLYGIAGAPRRGKTTFTLEIATNLATRNNIPVLFVTWEQTKKNLTYRLLAKETQINPDTLQRKQLSKNKELELKFAKGWRKMESFMDRLYIIEGSKKDTLERVKTYAYNAMQEFNTDEIVLFFDYLQKMPMSSQYLDEKFKVEEISTQLKLLSLELNCPIIVISSLNKEGCNIDTANDKSRPSIYHCKGSGDIEYDLDAGMIMAKDWEDSKELAEQMKNLAYSMGKNIEILPKVDIINIYLDKNRDAPEGISSVIQYLFLIEANKFVELGFKVETDTFRFKKIENILKNLIDEGYIKFRDGAGNATTENPTIDF
ncbi:MAG: DnaB-like helicase C-terminal domain-containing protein [Candidatus Muiribacteriaceae bacterium]